MKILYLSPSPFNSFKQRPHAFVQWLQSDLGAEVLWVNPYPTRLPRLNDLANLRRDIIGQVKSGTGDPKVVSPAWLPIEPLPGSTRLLGFLWRKIFESLKSFIDSSTVIVIAKPSHLASEILNRFPNNYVVFDVMDNFPAFYKGLAKKVMSKNFSSTLLRANFVSFSSTPLEVKYGSSATDSCVVLNAYDPSYLTEQNIPCSPNHKGPRKVLGYVGTIAEWFDWELVKDISVANPNLLIRLVGPVYKGPRSPLPENIEITGIRSHDQAMAEMREFDAGLIPFKVNELTEFVDPIKYYEYRALGLKVFTTAFGELRGKKLGCETILIGQLASLDEIGPALDAGLCDECPPTVVPTWESRFSGSRLLPVFRQYF